MRRNPRGSGKTQPSRILNLLGLIVVVGACALVWAKLQLSALDPGSRAKLLVKIPAGSSAVQVADLLANKGVVRSPYSILIAARLGSDSTRLKPGTYSLSPGETPEQILGIIADGRSAVVHITFPEGFTLHQMAVRLESRHLTNESKFENMARTEGRSFKAADGFTPPSDNLEGFLFPTTYDFLPGTTPREIIQTMVQRFDDRIVQAHPEIKDWYSPEIKASLIEREAEIEEDRPLIAAVIDNRLKIGMPLDIDATVEYALPAHKTRLMFSDLKTESPYNTYLHRGLPPGAICNPGQPSIEAALAPAHVDFLYYVQGPNHKHLFSRTLGEQDDNIAAVRKMRSNG